MEIVLKKVEEIKPYKNNPRFNDDAVKYVANSIKEFGFKQPIVIDKNNEIIAGHTRYKASLELGLKEVPCIVASDLTKEQVKAYRLADNKVSEKSQWDYELLNDELDDILNINMDDFGFLEQNIDWDDVDDLSEDTYDQPTHNMLECPSCHHIDRDIHFKKVEEYKEVDESE